MKKSIKLLVAVALILMAATNQIKAQDLSLDIIQSAIDTYDSKCPIEVNEGIFITKVELVNNYIHYYADIKPNQNDPEIYERIKENPENQKEVILVFLSTQSSNIVYQYCKKNQIGIKYTYTFNSDESTALEVVITPEEMTAALERKLPPHNMVIKLIENERANLPIDTGNGLTETDIKLTDDFVELYYTVDENKSNFEGVALVLATDEYKSILLNALTSSPATNLFVFYVAQDEKGLKLIYTGDQTQKSAECVITVEELKKELIKNANNK